MSSGHKCKKKSRYVNLCSSYCKKGKKNKKRFAIIFSSFWAFKTSSSPKIDRLTATFFLTQKGIAGLILRPSP